MYGSSPCHIIWLMWVARYLYSKCPCPIVGFKRIDPKCYTVLESLFFFRVSKNYFSPEKAKMVEKNLEKKTIFYPENYLEPKVFPPNLFSCIPNIWVQKLSTIYVILVWFENFFNHILQCIQLQKCGNFLHVSSNFP
jgi:hypothetical protein